MSLFAIFLLLIVVVVGIWLRLSDARELISKINRSEKRFAESNNLLFKPGRYLPYIEFPHIFGNYRGHTLKIRESKFLDLGEISKHSFERISYELKRKRRRIEIEREKSSQKSGRRLSAKEAIRRFQAIELFMVANRGQYKKLDATRHGEMITFGSIVKYADTDLSPCKLVADLIEAYPVVLKIGAGAIDILLKGSEHQPIIKQLVGDIATETIERISQNTDQFFCPKCLTYCSSHKARLPLKVDSFKYFGCRTCRQSRDLIRGRAIAILDLKMTEKQSVHGRKILVNWLTLRKPFDFHEIRIARASDKDVEHFVIQIGNDTDKFRQPRYRDLPCTVSPDSKLSENTLRILKNTFRQVVLK